MASDDPISQFLTTAKEAVTGFGLRVVVHMAALICAIGSGQTIQHGDTFAMYVGLICLIPRGMGANINWLLPVALGAIQVIVCFTFGMPLPLALLIGGAQAWLQRLLVKKGSLGWEWSALPWLCVAATLATLPPTFSSAIPISILVLVLIGWGIFHTYAKKYLDPLNRESLKNVAAQLQKILTEGILADPLTEPLRKLITQINTCVAQCPQLGLESTPLISTAQNVLAQVTRLKNRPIPKSWDADAGKCLASISQFNNSLNEKLILIKTAPKKAIEPGSPAAQATQFHDSAVQLNSKKHLLAADLHPHIDGICLATENILSCMKDEEGDFNAGNRFLSRYLAAAHRVVDEYARLAREGKQFDHVSAALARSKDLLARLETAFNAEHSRLLRNDSLNFTAELNVLDKLLKMDGQ